MDNGAFETSIMVTSIIAVISNIFIMIRKFIIKKRKQDEQSEVEMIMNTGKIIDADIFYYSLKQSLKGRGILKSDVGRTYLSFALNITFFITLSNLLVDNASSKKVIFILSLIYVIIYLLIIILAIKIRALKRIFGYIKNRTTLSFNLDGNNLNLKLFEKNEITMHKLSPLEDIEYVRECKSGYKISINMENEEVNKFQFDLCKFSLGAKDNIYEFNNILKTSLKEKFTSREESENKIDNARANISLVCGFLVLVLLNNIVSVYIVSFIGCYNALRCIFSDKGRFRAAIGFVVCFYFIIYNLIITG
ncbi:hypothetical protein [Clostridium grantii]|nr:hypothetical protein [Clostridium grantii]